jgi:hypothetical protein
VPPDTRGREQPPEAFLARLVDTARPDHHLDVELFEHGGMLAHEEIERPGGEGGVRFVHTLERTPRGLFVIEQGIVEIEEDGARNVTRLHRSIIETVGLSRMVN